MTINENLASDSAEDYLPVSNDAPSAVHEMDPIRALYRTQLGDNGALVEGEPVEVGSIAAVRAIFKFPQSLRVGAIGSHAQDRLGKLNVVDRDLRRGFVERFPYAIVRSRMSGVGRRDHACRAESASGTAAGVITLRDETWRAWRTVIRCCLGGQCLTIAS